ncbi:hypothetical protein [uncultured Desulfobacter sp.]|uniref:hypothetical protein n=1 Tax=uncultured Desulfobacter sp. TaxID=240139 RepID=UPI0029F519BF|nr:hypothetical protein [uncultured Desulfobacter sp.]
MYKINFFLLAMSLILGITSTAHSAIIKLSFAGTINNVVAGDHEIGQSISGFVIYDSETDLTYSTPGSPPYTNGFNGAIDSFILNALQVDTFSSNSITQTIGSNPNEAIEFSVSGFDDSTGLREDIYMRFNGDDLFSTPYSLTETLNFDDVEYAGFGYTLQKVGLNDGFLQERFYGYIDSIQIEIVPIPSSVIFLFSGVIGLLYKYREL